MFRKVKFAIAAGLLFGTAMSGQAFAGSTPGTLTVNATVNALCTIGSGGAVSLTFPAIGSDTTNLTNPVTANTSLSVTCTNAAPYNIGLDAGANSSNVNSRVLKSGSNTLTYSLYQDSGNSTVWGNTVGTNTKAATGNGASQSYTIYGKIPSGQALTVGTYSDTVNITVSF